MRNFKLQSNIILLLVLLISTASSVYAVSDGRGNFYFKDNIGIKEKNPSAALHVNGSILIDDGNAANNYILKSDSNGLASWAPISSIPGVIASNGNVNNLTISNGFFQDATLNGATTIGGNFYFPAGYTNGYVLTMQANGNAQWQANVAASSSSTNGEWLELSNTIYPADSNGQQNIGIGAQTEVDADIMLYENGAAYFNKQQNPDADFIVSGSTNAHLLFIDASEDRIAINHDSPSTTLDVKGHFSIRSGTAGGGSVDKDFTTTPDPFSAVFWLAQNSIYGDNGDLMARINVDGEDKIFTVIDFDGTSNGSTTQNGLTLTDLTANRLVSTNANGTLVSETNIIVDSNGFVGVGSSSPDAKLTIGSGTRDFIDGVNDLHVAGDIEADGTIYGANFIGNGSGLDFNGNTLRDAKIYTSTVYTTLDFNGASMIRAGSGPLLINGDSIFGGNAIMQAGYKLKLYAGTPGSEYVSFYSHDGKVGINTESPTTDLDINGQITIRGGSPAAGYVLTSDADGVASWQFLDSNNAAYAINATTATTASSASSMTNGTITNSSFTGGTINGATLVNVTFSNGTGLGEWNDGSDGLYPKDSSGAQNVFIGGASLAASTISLESNGTVRAVKFVGDGSGITGLGSSSWSDQGTFLHPANSESIVIGGTTILGSDIVFNADGSVIINEQAQDSDFRIEGQNQEYLFFTDASTNRVGINTSSPRTDLDINGSLAYTIHRVDISAGTGLSSAVVQANTVVYVQNAANACSVDITANPQIAAGVDGQILTLVGSYTNEEVLLEDGAGLALNSNVSFRLKAKDSITFVYSSAFGEWVEVSRNNYTERSGETITRGACI